MFKSSPTIFRSLLCALIVLFGAMTVTQCSVNPATGKRHLSLVSEAQEIAMGREADPQIVAQFGLYPDDGLQRYVQDLGARLAAESERPDLPWTFRVLDDPLVNAFALPGGFIYVTRGIMAHLDSEAELVGVLGHEIGHVTARHGANQMSKGMLANLGLGLGMVLAPEAAQTFGGLAQGLTSLLFLKYGRDDEKQADELGVRYALRTDHDPRELIGVFETLGRVSAASGAGGGAPAWASTHPAPANRAELINRRIAELNRPLTGLTVDEAGYTAKLDGVTYGADVRQGFFVNERFYHPEMAFVLDFPQGWQTMNSRQRVAALSPEQNAMVDLTLANGDSPRSAGDRFYQQQGISPKSNWNNVSSGFRGVTRTFGVVNQQGAEVIEGVSNFVQDGERVYQLLGYGKANTRGINWRGIESSVDSIRRLTDRKILGVQPMKIDLVKLNRPLSVDNLSQLRSDVSDRELMLINRLDPGQVIPAGTTIKVVKGFNPENGLPR